MSSRIRATEHPTLIDPYPGGKDVFGGKFEKGKAPVFDIKSSQTEIVIETAK